MADACKTYTRSILLMTGIKHIITIGLYATKQMVGNAEFKWGVQLGKSTKVLPIMHYAAPAYDSEFAKDAVRAFMEASK